MKLFRKIKYHIKHFLFEKYAIPIVKNERISKGILKKYLPDNPVIVDCGAHDGSDSIGLAKLFKRGTIHSFEPVDTLYGMLVKNARLYNNVICHQLALANTDGTMDFYISEGASDGSSSLLKPAEHIKDHPDTFFKKQIKVATRTLDSWAKENHIEKVDMLWLDMQGYEMKMLEASSVILETVSVIHTEVSTRETYEDVTQYKDYRLFLEAKGFSAQIEAVPNGWDMGNVLFARNR